MIHNALIILMMAGYGWVAQAQEVPREVILQPAPAPASALQEFQAAEPKPLPVVKLDTPIPSMFFAGDEVAALKQSRDAFNARIPGQPASEGDLLDQLQGIKSMQEQPQELQETHYPQFYLANLMYRSRNLWSATLMTHEGRKNFSSENTSTPDGSIKILSVSAEGMFFEWKPKNWPYVESKFKPGSALHIEPNKKIVYATLGVNQTFFAHDMSVREGTAAPIPVAPPAEDGNNLPLAEVNATTPSNAPANAPASEGILQLYQNLESPAP